MHPSVKLGPFEFLVASDRAIVRRQDLLKYLPVCFLYFSAKSLKRLYKALFNVFIEYFEMNKQALKRF